MSTVASTVVSVVLSRRLSNLPSSLQRALSNKALLASKYDARLAAAGRSLNDDISYSDPLNLKSLTRLTALDKAEIVARAWRGQNSVGIAQIFGVTSRTVNRVIREQSNARK